MSIHTTSIYPDYRKHASYYHFPPARREIQVLEDEMLSFLKEYFKQKKVALHPKSREWQL